ncbi:hypothetical protein MMPV_008345, partial [Pyropia vietnamensis]
SRGRQRTSGTADNDEDATVVDAEVPWGWPATSSLPPPAAGGGRGGGPKVAAVAAAARMARVRSWHVDGDERGTGGEGLRDSTVSPWRAAGGCDKKRKQHREREDERQPVSLGAVRRHRRQGHGGALSPHGGDGDGSIEGGDGGGMHRPASAPAGAAYAPPSSGRGSPRRCPDGHTAAAPRWRPVPAPSAASQPRGGGNADGHGGRGTPPAGGARLHLRRHRDGGGAPRAAPLPLSWGDTWPAEAAAASDGSDDGSESGRGGDVGGIVDDPPQRRRRRLAAPSPDTARCKSRIRGNGGSGTSTATSTIDSAADPPVAPRSASFGSAASRRSARSRGGSPLTEEEDDMGIDGAANRGDHDGDTVPNSIGGRSRGDSDPPPALSISEAGGLSFGASVLYSGAPFTPVESLPSEAFARLSPTGRGGSPPSAVGGWRGPLPRKEPPKTNGGGRRPGAGVGDGGGGCRDDNDSRDGRDARRHRPRRPRPRSPPPAACRQVSLPSPRGGDDIDDADSGGHMSSPRRCSFPSTSLLMAGTAGRGPPAVGGVAVHPSGKDSGGGGGDSGSGPHSIGGGGGGGTPVHSYASFGSWRRRRAAAAAAAAAADADAATYGGGAHVSQRLWLTDGGEGGDCAAAVAAAAAAGGAGGGGPSSRKLRFRGWGGGGSAAGDASVRGAKCRGAARERGVLGGGTPWAPPRGGVSTPTPIAAGGLPSATARATRRGAPRSSMPLSGEPALDGGAAGPVRRWVTACISDCAG